MLSCCPRPVVETVGTPRHTVAVTTPSTRAEAVIGNLIARCVRGERRPRALRSPVPRPVGESIRSGRCRRGAGADLPTRAAPPVLVCRCHPVDLAQPDHAAVRGQPSTRSQPTSPSSARGRPPCGSPTGGLRDGTPPSRRPPARRRLDPSSLFDSRQSARRKEFDISGQSGSTEKLCS